MKLIDRFIEITYNPITLTWLSEIQKNVIWKNYLFNNSGDKEESPLLENYIFKDVTPEKLTSLTDIINTMFKDKWDRLHDALNLEYGVIDNYNRLEDTTITNSGTNNNQINNSNTDVMSGGHSNVNSTDNRHKVSAYDNDTLSDDTLDMNNSTDTFSYDNETKTTSGSETTSGSSTGETITHSEIKGNIGVTTSQQMINSEIELRMFNIITQIYKDLDTILTTGIYIN